MNLMELAIKVGVDDQASNKLEGISSKAVAKGVVIGQAMYDAMKVVAGAVVDVGKQALQAYSDYEQLSGGVAKLYGNANQSVEQYAASQGKAVDQVIGDWQRNENAQKTVMANAAQAYKTSGMSANQYMQQATSFSAALINSLGGDTQRAADMTDVAMRAMSDNVNTFGSNAEDVSNAFNGFAKQNYTMLDNLKLGYGGTKQEMQRLIDDANAWGAANGEASNLSIDSFADVVTAIQQIQEKQGIAGTTAKEAASTIEGSINMMKASWENWMAGLGNSTADMGALTDELLQSVDAVIQNVGPRVLVIADSIVQAVPGLVQKAVSRIPGLVADAAGIINESFNGIFSQGPDFGAFEESVSDSVQRVIDRFDYLKTTFDTIMSGIDWGPMLDGLSGLWEGIQQLGDDLMGLDFNGLFEGIANGAQAMVDLVGPAFQTLGDVLKDPAVQEALQNITDALGVLANVVGAVLGFAIGLVVALFAGLIEVIANVVNVLADVIGAIGDFAASVVQFFTGDIPGAFDTLVAFFTELPGQIFAFLSQVIADIGAWVLQVAADAQQAGSQFLQGVVSFFSQLPGQVAAFLSTIISNVVSWVSQMASNASSAGSQFLNNVVNFVTQLPGRIAAFLASIIANVVSWVQQMASNASSAGQQFLQNVVNFITQLPGRIASFLASIISNVLSWASQMASNASRAGQQFLQNVVNFVTQLPGRIASLLSQAISRVIAFAGQMGSAAIQAGQRFLSGIQGGLNAAVGFVASIPGRILRALGNVGNLLYNAGRSILTGFLNGLKSVWGSITSFVGNIAGWIASHKGPLDYDRRLLIPAGGAIMEGLLGGLTSGFEGNVIPYVSSMAGAMEDAMGTSAMLIGGVTTATVPGASAALGGKVDEMVDLLAQILDKDTDVYMDGRKVSSALYGASRTQLVGRGLA